MFVVRLARVIIRNTERDLLPLVYLTVVKIPHLGPIVDMIPLLDSNALIHLQRQLDVVQLSPPSVAVLATSILDCLYTFRRDQQLVDYVVSEVCVCVWLNGGRTYDCVFRCALIMTSLHGFNV